MNGCGDGCIVFVTATLLFLLPFALGRATSFLASALTWFDRRRSGPPDELPRLYWRTCTSCGFEWTWKPGDPPGKGRPRRRSAARIRGRRPPDKQRRLQLQWTTDQGYQPFLDELIAHWKDAHRPETGFSLDTPDTALAFFQSYQRALGEEPTLQPGHRPAGFVRNHVPRREEILPFTTAYQRLRRGEHAAAARDFQELVRSCPQFADPWIWLSATLDDPAKRITCLDRAVLLEPAHPLALDALDIAQGKVPSRPVSEAELVFVRCPQCGGKLAYAPGAEAIECEHCGHEIHLRRTRPPARRAPSLTTLRLMRRYQDRVWDGVEHIHHCQACGAGLVTSRHLAQACAYCGSTHVLVEDDPRILQQPDSLVPFEIDREGAAEAVRGAGHTEAKIAALRGLYVPFYLFDGAVEIRWLQRYQDQDPDSAREDKLVYNNICFPAVDVPPPSLLDELPPFHLYRLVSFRADLLADWPAQLPNLDVEVVAEDAHDAMLALARKQSGLPVKVQISWDGDGDKPTPSQAARSFQVCGVTYQLVLIPVWVAVLQDRKGRGLALVNGQTGKVVSGLVLPAGSNTQRDRLRRLGS